MSAPVGIPAMRPAVEHVGSASVAQADDGVAGGVVDGDGIPELHFVRPLPGFPDLTRYALVRLGPEGSGTDGSDGSDGPDGPDDDSDAPTVLFELRSLEQPQVRFLVGVPSAFFPDYEVEIDDASALDLDLTDAADALVLVVLTVGADAASTTANLLAPVVVNARTRSAAQVILSGSDWPVRAAVV